MSLTVSPAQIVEESDSPLLSSADHWQRLPLGEVATILNGFAFKSRWFVTGAGTPLIRIRDIFSDHTAVGYSGGYDKQYVVQPGELLVGMDGDFHCARWRGPAALLNQRVCKVVPHSNRLDLGFLTHLLPGYLQAIHDVTSSTTVTHLSSRDLARLPIPIPSLSEQRLLASALDVAADSQRSSLAHMAAARRAVVQFRQSVLTAACSGRLTADWRDRGQSGPGQDAEDAATYVSRLDALRRIRLGRRYRQPAQVPADQEIPESWMWTSVGALVDVATGATPLRKRADYYSGSIPWVTSGAVNSALITEPSALITDLAIKETNAKVFPPGTLLVAMYGEGQTRGRVAELGFAAATNQAVAALLFDEHSEQLRPYLRLFFLENYERIRRLSFGGVQPNLSLSVIRDTPVPLPPLEEQKMIVGRTELLLNHADSVEGRTSVARGQVAIISRGICAKAFRGELLQPDRDDVPCEVGAGVD